MEAASIQRAALSRRSYVVVFLLGFVCYGYFRPPTSWNENSRFNLVRAIVERGSLNIDPYHGNTGDKSYFEGHYYSDKAPGTSFAAVPAYAAYFAFLKLSGAAPPAQQSGATPQDAPWSSSSYLWGLHLASIASVALISAMGVMVFLFLASFFTREPRLALLATLAYGFASLALPYATVFYGHQLAASLLLMAFALLFEQKCSSRWQGWRCAAAGFSPRQLW